MKIIELKASVEANQSPRGKPLSATIKGYLQKFCYKLKIDNEE